MMWILIGINAYSYLTAAMTSASSLTIASIDDMKGLKLAAVNGSIEHEVTFSLGVEVIIIYFENHLFKFDRKNIEQYNYLYNEETTCAV